MTFKYYKTTLAYVLTMNGATLLTMQMGHPIKCRKYSKS